MRMHIITNCSSTRLIAPVVKVQDLPSGLSNQEALDQWVNMLDANKASTTPREQYRGQGFMTLLKTLNDFKPESVQIITGGLGFTDIDDNIVPYDFSGSPKEEHNITQKVTKEPFSLPVWWSMINKRRFGDANPVATYISQLGEDEVCVISLTKIFLKYIASDFLSAPEAAKQKCRILLTASSIGSVPMQLRPYIVSFERSAIAHIPGNRNDINHRALWQFLDRVKDVETFSNPAYSLASSVFGLSSGAASGESEAIRDRGMAAMDVAATLRKRPELLKMNPEFAYKTLYREVGPFGGRQNFKGMFIKAQMDAGIIAALPEQEVDDDALDALGSLNLKEATTATDDDTQEALDLLNIFIGAVRRANPNAEFNAADVCTWATNYTNKKGLKLPDVLTMPIKLAYFLKSYYGALGLNKGEKTFSIAASPISSTPPQKVAAE